MQANWDKNSLRWDIFFFQVNVGWKVPHSDETSHLGETSHNKQEDPKIGLFLKLVKAPNYFRKTMHLKNSIGKLLSIFTKHSILEIRQEPEYFSKYDLKCCI